MYLVPATQDCDKHSAYVVLQVKEGEVPQLLLKGFNATTATQLGLIFINWNYENVIAAMICNSIFFTCSEFSKQTLYKENLLQIQSSGLASVTL